MARPNNVPKMPRFVLLAAICVVVAALYFGREVLIPLALATLFTFVISPLVWRLERWGLWRAPSVLIVALLAFGVVGAIGYIVYGQVADLASQLPNYRHNIEQKVSLVRSTFTGGISQAVKATAEIVRNAATTTASTTAPAAQPSPSGPAPIQPVSAQPVVPSAEGGFEWPVWTVVHVLTTAFIVAVLVLFFLFQQEDLRDRLIHLIGHGQLTLTTQALDDAAGRVSRYLLALALVNGMYGTAVAVGLWAIGLLIGGHAFPSFVLLGLITGLLRFVPYIGPWLGASFPLLLAVAVYPGWAVFVSVLVMFIVYELIASNLVEPLLYGARTGVSPVAVLVAAIFWTWLWGPIGLLLSTPQTVCLAVIGRYVPQLSFLAILLGDAPVLAAHERFYQRLLASDEEEATALVEQDLKQHALESTYDRIVLSALAMAEHDRYRGELDDRHHAMVHERMRELILHLDERDETGATPTAATPASQPDAPADEPAPRNGNGPAYRNAARSGSAATAAEQTQPPGILIRHLPQGSVVSVVCLPCRGQADELTAIMFSQVLQSYGYQASWLSSDTLASEMLKHVEQMRPHIVVTCAVPPAAVLHARYLCKRLSRRFADLRLLVGLWTSRTDLSRAHDELACSDAAKLANSFQMGLQAVQEMAQPVILARSTSSAESSLSASASAGPAGSGSASNSTDPSAPEAR